MKTFWYYWDKFWATVEEALQGDFNTPMTNQPPQQPPTPPTPAPVPSATPVASAFRPNIVVWARAIQHQEGGKPTDRNMVNNNPGNLKFLPYERSLGATSHDAGNFCVFPSYIVGFNALCQFLTDACHNLLIPYHNVTLAQFTETYAQPPNDNYVNGVAAALGAPTSTPISHLI